MDRFAGLGQLHANQLLSLADTRLPVGETQFRTARAAWNAFTSPDPTEIERFIATDTSAFRLLLQHCGVIWNSSLLSITACLARSAKHFPSFVIRVRSLGQGSSSQYEIWRNRSLWGSTRFIG